MTEQKTATATHSFTGAESDAMLSHSQVIRLLAEKHSMDDMLESCEIIDGHAWPFDKPLAKGEFDEILHGTGTIRSAALEYEYAKREEENKPGWKYAEAFDIYRCCNAIEELIPAAIHDAIVEDYKAEIAEREAARGKSVAEA